VWAIIEAEVASEESLAADRPTLLEKIRHAIARFRRWV
jgi:hypothetical protein